MLSFETSKSIERIYQGARKPAEWDCSCPHLFPFVCGTDGEYTVDGKAYTRKRHGILMRNPNAKFKVVDQTENSVTFEMTANEDTERHFPFKNWTLRIKYTIKSDSIVTETEITNDSTETIAFGYGNHPAYALPSMENGYVLLKRVTDITGKEIIAKETEEPMPISLFTGDGKLFENIISATVEVFIKDSRGNFVKIAETEKRGPNICLWTKGPFVCVESLAANDNTFQELVGKESTREDMANHPESISVAPGQIYVHRDYVTFLNDEKFQEAVKRNDISQENNR